MNCLIRNSNGELETIKMEIIALKEKLIKFQRYQKKKISEYEDRAIEMIQFK